MYSEILWMLSLNVKVLENFKLASVFDLCFDLISSDFGLVFEHVEPSLLRGSGEATFG